MTIRRFRQTGTADARMMIAGRNPSRRNPSQTHRDTAPSGPVHPLQEVNRVIG